MILTLTSEYVRNTVFTDEQGLPVFKSDTPFRFGTRTTTISRQRVPSENFDVNRNPTEVMGQIQWNFWGSSIFRIGGTELESNVFLPRHGFFGRKRTFTGPDGRKYRWDMHWRVVVLSLDNESRTEVARYHRATFRFFGKGRNAYLEIAPEVEHMLDLVILTFLYVEKLRMDKEDRQRAAAYSGGGGGP